MTFVLKDGGAASEQLAGWPLPPAPQFAPSRAYLRLYRAIRRYVDQDIPGRSFLIAGHRGAGKTALVTRVIENLQAERLRESVKESGEFTGGADSAMQRPLFVKLHGPSLLGAVQPAAARKEAAAPPSGEEADPKPAEGNGEGSATTQGEAGGSPAREHSESYLALIQITLALYRALAQEIATGFAAHARMMSGRSSGANDFLEIAGQLTLELDAAPHPAVLRRYWSMLGRLPAQGRHSGYGVLWPRTADPTLHDLGRDDQGFREIIAVATAAQTYRVTAGQITDKDDRTTEDKSEATLTARIANINGLFDRAAALIAGTLAGGAALSQAPASATGAVGLGLATALLTGLALGWTSTRTRKREQILKYTFIWRHDEATLERDLPTVIRRIRDAGLAPVFVLDELDKLENPREKIRALIRRLKHLVTDHGFFCFLTDRNYYEETERLIETSPYPREHTFFSERMLILYRSSEFLAFIKDLIDVDPDTPENGFARLLLSLSIIHEAKLNFADVTRAISDLVGEKRSLAGEKLNLRVTEEEVRRQPRYQHRAVMQLAVDEILRGPALADRLEAYPGFAQLAVDALYMVSRWWERDEKVIVIVPEAAEDKDEVRDYLNERLRGSYEQGEKPTDPVEVDESDLELLRGEIVNLCELLCDLKSLSAKVAARTDLPAANPENVVPKSVDRLLDKKDGTKGTWCFLFQSTGAARGASAADSADRDRLVAFVRAVEALSRASGLDVPNLVGAGVLPPSVDWSHVLQAAAGDPATAGGPDPADLARLREFENIYSSRIEAVRETVLLVDSLRRQVGLVREEAPAVLGRLTSYLDFAAAASGESPPGLLSSAAVDTLAPLLQPNAASVQELADWLEGPEAEVPGSPPAPEDEDIGWGLWRTRLRFHFDRRGTPPAIQPLELSLAAAGTPAGTWFRLPLDRMTIREWSLLALRAMGFTSTTPPWVAPAALRALGFGQPLLARLREWLKGRAPPDGWKPEDDSILNEILGGAGECPPGLLHLAVRPGAVLDNVPGREPVFAGLVEECLPFQEEIYALYEMGAFKARTDEPF